MKNTKSLLSSFTIILILYIVIFFITPIKAFDTYTTSDINRDGINELNNGFQNSAWPMYCHDIRHTGRSSYISTGNWYAEKWKFYMGGWIESSPAIDCNGTIYIGGDYDLCLYAISPGGTEKWRANIGDTLSSPAIGKDNTIYIGTNAGRLYAINANGTIKWWVSLGDGWAYSSPAIDNNGTIYCASTFSNRLAAVYPNGTIKWFFNAQGYIYCSPAIGGDGTIYIGSNDGYLYAINPNGTLNWKYYAGGQKGIATTSIADDGTIYAGGTAGYLYALYSNGTLKWKVYTGWIGGSTPAIADDGTIYVGAQGPNRIYSISPTGTINWYYETNGEILTSPAIDAQGNIYCASDDYNLYALNKNGTLRWAFHAANEDIVSSPVVGENGTIFITGIFWGSGSTPDHSYLFALETINDTNPAIPSITGDENGQVHRKHDYTIASTDPDNDNISYYIDWGDGKSNDWTTPTPSGKAITLSHIWQKKGMYTIKVKARDEHLMESDWGTLSVTMPLAYEQPHFRFFEWLLERFPHAFPFLRLLFHQ